MSKQTDLINVTDAITISGSNVGIGTSSPDKKFVVSEGGAHGFEISPYDGNQNATRLINYNRNTNAYFPLEIEASQIAFETNAAERMRIDSSGNVLVGKTVQSIATDGVTVVNGQITATSDGADAIRLNRKTSDGSIIDLRKDGTTVGSIGVASGDNLYIGATTANHSGVYFGTNIVYPMTAGSISDDSVNLGHSSYRFKDAYLSGGVYLGGVGSANKLEDYEEGTWNPTYLGSTGNPTITYDSERSASYIKVGKIVFIQGSIKTDAASGGSGNLYLGGLPFTSASAVSPKRKGGINVSGYQTAFSGSDKPTGGYINANVNRVILMSNRSTTSAITVQTTALNNTTNDNFMMFHGQYVID